MMAKEEIHVCYGCGKQFKRAADLGQHQVKKRACAFELGKRLFRPTNNGDESNKNESFEPSNDDFGSFDAYSVSSIEETPVTPSGDSTNDGVFLLSDVEMDQRMPFCPTDIIDLELVEMLEGFGAPLGAYDKIMTWVHNAVIGGYDFTRKPKTREAFMKKLRERYNLQGLDPITEDIPVLGPVDKATIIRFDFKEQLMALIHDRNVWNEDNLVFNRDQPYGKYKNNGPISEMMDGKWYSDAYDRCINDPNTQFLMPILLYIDKTHIDLNSRFGLEPVMFTVANLNQSTRAKDSAWKHLGFVSQYDKFLSEEEKNALRGSAGIFPVNYHRQLRGILSSLIELQNDPMTIFLPIGNNIKKVEIIIELCAVLGDGEGSDRVCARKECRSEKAKRLMRMCTCPYDHADNPSFKCKLIKQTDIMGLTEDENFEELEKMGQWPIPNAMFDVSFGGCPYGIFSATTPCIMHFFKEGWIMYATKAILIGLQPKYRRMIAKSASAITYVQKQSARTELPRVNYVKGVIKTVCVTHEERMGILLHIYIAFLIKDNYKALVQSKGKASIDGIIHVMERLLIFEAYLLRNGAGFWALEDADIEEPKLKRKIARLIRDLVKYIPRDEGAGWKLQKIHEAMHIPRQITMRGPPRGVDTGANENHHITKAKRPAKQVRKRHGTFEWDVAQRVSDQLAVQTAFDRINNVMEISSGLSCDSTSTDETDNGANYSLTGATNYTITMDEDEMGDQTVSIEWHSKNGKMPKTDPTVVNFLVEVLGEKGFNEIECYTHFTRKGILFRAHPDFQSTGEWYDWILCRYEKDIYVGRARNYGVEEVDIPAKIVCIVLLPGSEEDGVSELCVVAHSCEWKTSSIGSLASEWSLKYKADGTPAYEMVNPETIVGHTYCIQECPGINGKKPKSTRVLQLKSRGEWYKLF